MSTLTGGVPIILSKLEADVICSMADKIRKAEIDLKQGEQEMIIKRTETVTGDDYKVGDIIAFTLSTGEEVEAMAMKQEKDGMIFAFVDCLEDEYAMNDESTNEGGYDESDMRQFLNDELLDCFPNGIRDKMKSFANGDYLRLMTEKEIFGENYSGEDEGDEITQFEPMKSRRNRIALQGKNGSPNWYWLANKVKDSAASFANVYGNGLANYYGASASHGVRPAFKI